MGMGSEISGGGKRVEIAWPLVCRGLVSCGESEEDLRAMVGRFIEVCRIRGLKFNAGKSKVMVLDGEEGLECGICVDGLCLEHVSEFKYWDLFWTNQVLMRKSVVGRW